MKQFSLFLIFILISVTTSTCDSLLPANIPLTATPTFISTSTLLPTLTPTLTPTYTPSSTLPPTPTTAPACKIPINPINTLVFHPADQHILYNWFSYVPAGLNKTKPIFILLTALTINGIVYNDPTASYKNETAEAKFGITSDLSLPNINNFVLLTPVIPAIAVNGNEVVPENFTLNSFQSPDEFTQRADLKVNTIIDYFSDLLREDGYIVSKKVLMQSFSKGGVFAQRYALLHPERVLAIAAGGIANLVLPLHSYDGVLLDWPGGINDLEALT